MTALRLFAPTGDESPAPGTVAHIIDLFIADRRAQADANLLSHEAVYQSERYCSAFADLVGTLTISQCRPGDLKRFLAAHPQWKTPATQRNALHRVITCFLWAEAERLVERCPYHMPKGLGACEPRLPITRAEVCAILDHARHGGYRTTCSRFRLAVWFMWETGIRTCELFRLDWSHYDPVRGCFELRSKTTRATGAKRLIALSRRAWRLICWMRRRSRQPGPVFLNGRNRRWNKDSFGELFRRHASLAGVRPEISAYCLRHGFCCEHLELGTGERQIADLMGHTSTKLIGWYGRGVKARVDYLRGVADKRHNATDRDKPR